MKRYLFILIFIIFGISCSGGGNNQPTSPSSISTSIRLSLRATGLGIPTSGIDEIILTITGPGMSTITERVDPGRGEAIVNVPAGPNRTFTLTIRAGSNVYTGFTTIDIPPGGLIDVVIPVNVNEIPEIIGISAPSPVNPGETITVSANIRNNDRDPLTYSWSSNCGSISGSGLSVRWTAPNTQGSCDITLVVDDGRGGMASRSISIRVNPLPSVPPPQPILLPDLVVNKIFKSPAGSLGYDTKVTVEIENIGNKDSGYFLVRFNETCAPGGTLIAPVSSIPAGGISSVSVIYPSNIIFYGSHIVVGVTLDYVNEVIESNEGNNTGILDEGCE